MTPTGQRLLGKYNAGPNSNLAQIVRDIESEARAWVTPTPGSKPCPGYGRPCGVLTPRALCFFCQRTKRG